MTVRYDKPDEMIAWAAAQLGGAYHTDARAIGVEHDGQLRAVAVFDHFTTRDCHVSVVAQPGTMWLTQGFAQAVAAYVFITCRKPRCTSMIPEWHTDALRLAAQLGAKHEGTQREGGPDGSDVLMYGLLRRDCRWVPKTILPALANSR